MAEAGILYVLPNGSDTSDCSHSIPCSLLQATTLARGAAAPPIIRLLPAVYPGSLDLATPTMLPLKYVASGATMASPFPVNVQNGASVEIRGLTAIGSSLAVQCTSSTTAKSAVTLRDAILKPGDGGAGLIYLEKCALSMSGGELDIGSSTGTSVLLRSDSGFTADRIHVHGEQASGIAAALAERVFVKITNSVLDNVTFQWGTSDAGPPGSGISIGFNTIVGHLNCQPNSGSPYRTAYYANNIVVSTNGTSVVDGTDCALSNNILFPFTGTLGTNMNVDPAFEDIAGRNYRLRPSSPAVDAAIPTAGLPATTDFAGVARPQGAQPDIGAFERTP